MPYRRRGNNRRYGRRRRRYGRRMTFRRKRSFRPRVMPRGELKRHRNIFTGSVGQTGSVNILTDVGQGLTSQDRIGNWIKPSHINFHIHTNGNTANNVAYISLRYVLFRWVPDLTVDAPSVAEIMQTPSEPIGPFNFANKYKFNVLWTRVFQIVNRTGNPRSVMKHSGKIRLGRRGQITFDENLDKMRHVFIMFLSDAPTLDDQPQFHAQFTLRYHDL